MTLDGSGLGLGLQGLLGGGFTDTLARQGGAGPGLGRGGASGPAAPARPPCQVLPPEPPLPSPPPRGAARAPLRFQPASMAFLTAWKGAAPGKRDRRYQAGRGLCEGCGWEGGTGGEQLETAVCGLLGAG